MPRLPRDREAGRVNIVCPMCGLYLAVPWPSFDSPDAIEMSKVMALILHFHERHSDLLPHRIDE